LSIRLNHLPPFTPFSRVSSIRSVQTPGSTHGHRARMSPTCVVPLDTVVGLSSDCSSFTHPPSCAPLLHHVSTASTLLRALRLPHGSPAARFSPLHTLGLYNHSVTNHLTFPIIAFTHYPSA
jgi:hypothetical protein